MQIRPVGSLTTFQTTRMLQSGLIDFKVPRHPTHTHTSFWHSAFDETLQSQSVSSEWNISILSDPFKFFHPRSFNNYTQKISQSSAFLSEGSSYAPIYNGVLSPLHMNKHTFNVNWCIIQRKTYETEFFAKLFYDLFTQLMFTIRYQKNFKRLPISHTKTQNKRISQHRYLEYIY